MSFTPEGTVTSPTQQGDADVTSPAGGAGQPMPEVDLPVADVDPDKLARIAATRGYLSQGDISKAQTAGVPESQLRDLFNRYLYLIQGDQGEEVGSEDKFGLGPKFSEGTLGLGGGPIVPVPAAGEGLIGDDGGLIGPEGGEDIFDFTGGGEGEGEGTGPGGGEGTGEGEAGTGGEGEGAGGVGTGELELAAKAKELEALVLEKALEKALERARVQALLLDRVLERVEELQTNLMMMSIQRSLARGRMVDGY